MLLLIIQIPEYSFLWLFPEVESYQPQEDLTDKYMHIQLFFFLKKNLNVYKLGIISKLDPIPRHTEQT